MPYPHTSISPSREVQTRSPPQHAFDLRQPGAMPDLVLGDAGAMTDDVHKRRINDCAEHASDFAADMFDDPGVVPVDKPGPASTACDHFCE